MMATNFLYGSESRTMQTKDKRILTAKTSLLQNRWNQGFLEGRN